MSNEKEKTKPETNSAESSIEPIKPIKMAQIIFDNRSVTSFVLATSAEPKPQSDQNTPHQNDLSKNTSSESQKNSSDQKSE